ncbi:MAG: putative endonuclease [Parcubacteria group bacterium Gr01-1014_3]|nr:MAG: putative endonuclease [Parcubacteria group bacterium Gr01-1014_3]
MFHYVYVVESIKFGGLYVGYTTDLKRRLKEHNNGLNFSTKPYMPWKFVFCEVFRNEQDARRRECYLKTNQGSRFLKRMLKEYFYSKRSKN